MYNGFIVTDKMRNKKAYNGQTPKFGITIDNVDYIVKFRGNSMSSHYSEYAASRFIHSLGLPVHKVWLGVYASSGSKIPIVIIQDFTAGGWKLHSYGATKQSSEDTLIETKAYTYADISHMINKHTKLTPQLKKQAITQFWQQFVCDAILGNRDRHSGNWGYLAKDNIYKIAPIFDNGASLFPDVDKRINEFNFNNEFNFLCARSERFPESIICEKRANGEIRRTNYYEVLGDLRKSRVLAEVVKEFRQKIGFEQIYRNICFATNSASQFIPPTYRRFYDMIVCVRYLHIVERKDLKKSHSIVKRRIGQ